MQYNDMERKISLHNDNDETVILTVDDFGDYMRVDLTVPEYKEDGVVKCPRRSLQFTSTEWDDLVAEVEKCRKARALLGLSS